PRSALFPDSTLFRSPTQAGFLLLEAALLRSDDAKSSEELLVQAATSAPDLPLVYLHGEHQARQRGDAELLLSWLRQRRENATDSRSEEHTSELQSREKLVCRL